MHNESHPLAGQTTPVKNDVEIERTKIVLRFADSSISPGWFVALDSASGGYPYAVDDPTRAKFWDTEKDARDYASSFTEGGSYAAYAIDPQPYIMRVVIEESAQADDIDLDVENWTASDIDLHDEIVRKRVRLGEIVGEDPQLEARIARRRVELGL